MEADKSKEQVAAVLTTLHGKDIREDHPDLSSEKNREYLDVDQDFLKKMRGGRSSKFCVTYPGTEATLIFRLLGYKEIDAAMLRVEQEFHKHKVLLPSLDVEFNLIRFKMETLLFEASKPLRSDSDTGALLSLNSESGVVSQEEGTHIKNVATLQSMTVEELTYWFDSWSYYQQTFSPKLEEMTKQDFEDLILSLKKNRELLKGLSYAKSVQIGGAYLDLLEALETTQMDNLRTPSSVVSSMPN